MRRFVSTSALFLASACSSSDPPSTPVDSGSDVAFTDATSEAATDAPSVVPAGARKLALEVNPPSSADYTKSLDEAVALGVKVYPITLIWGALLEKTPGTIDDSWFKLVHDVTAPRGMSVAVSIPIVDTVSILAPSDLAPKLEDGTTALDDAAVIARYEKVLDSMYASFGASPKVEWLVISNEVNVYLSGEPEVRWDALRKFFESIRTYVKGKHPETTVTMSVTFGGLTDAAQRPKVDALTAAADAVMTTYYLGDNGFGGMVGTAVDDDLQAMLAYAGKRPLIIKEWGYATGTKGHSPSAQADFVDATFAAWDAHADRIPLLTYSRMWDGDRKDCESQAASYGSPGNEEFIQFLCTLGLRTFDGADKPGMARFAAAAKARGF
jgi:hypothetical protein